MITQERHEEIGRPVLKDKTQPDIASAFKELTAEFANTQTAVRVRSANQKTFQRPFIVLSIPIGWQAA